jgi:ABC-type transport system involved in multi-copper enzyme maturation permease subunit
LILVRSLLALALAAVLWCLLWLWWVTALNEPTYEPTTLLRFALVSVATVMLVIVVIQAPAVLAGSLAGERERGVLQLLLTTNVSPREIVSGRLAGKLSQVGMILIAGLPLLAILFAWNGFGFADLLTIFLLLAAVGFGGGGLAVGASIVSRRGRDALLSVYILMVILLMSPLLSWVGLPVEIAEWLLWFNPFFSLNRLIFDAQIAPALTTSAAWSAMGTAGTIIAAWRMRPTCLGSGDARKISRRQLWVPPLGDRPMLWKELYIERVGTLGRFGRWFGVVITVAFGGGSLVLGAIMLLAHFWEPAADWSVGAKSLMSAVLAGAGGMFVGWLLQWAVGLRASVSIASERERESWDAILMSPLEAREIVWAKLFGSLYALRWMVAAFLVAWTLAVSVGAISLHDYITWVAGTAVAALLMAAIGVRCSLSLPTATKSMTWTIALWMISGGCIAIVALSIILGIWMLILTLWMAAMSYGYIPPSTRPWVSPIGWDLGWPLTFDLVTLVVTFMLVLDTSLRFDRIAGRMAGGKVATKVDKWLRGGEYQPVFLPSKKPPTARKATPRTVPVTEPVAAGEVVVVD